MRSSLLTIFVLLCTLLLVDGAPIRERKLKLKLPKLGGGTRTPPPVQAPAPLPVKITPPPPPPVVKVPPPPPPPVVVTPPPPPPPVKVPPPPPPPVVVTPPPPPPPVKVPPPPPPPVKVPSPPPPAVKVTPTPTPSPAKVTSTPSPLPAKATSSLQVTSNTVQTSASAKAATISETATPSAKACPIRRPTTGKKAAGSIKGRAPTTSTTDDECGDVDAEICSAVTDCNQCITTATSTGKCGFTFEGVCVPGNAQGLGQLATTKQQCKSIADQQATNAANSDDGVIATAASTIYKSKIENHILGRGEKDKRSGRHLLSIWTKDNTDSTESQRNDQTGVVRFAIPNSKKPKTVWNDVKGAGVSYTEGQVQALCERALFHSIRANPKTKTILTDIKNAGAGETSAAGGKKGKGKGKAPAATSAKDLKPLGGLKNGFVTKNPVTGTNMCINVSEVSCFPTSLGSVSGTEGSPCQGDVDEED